MSDIRAHLKFLSFAWIAGSSLILTVACSGGGKSLPSGPPAAPTPAATPASAQATNSGRNGGQNQKANGTDLNKQSSTSSQEIKDAPPDDGGAPAPATLPKPSATPGREIVDGEVVMNPVGLTPDQIFNASARQGSSFRGVKAAVSGGTGALYYSGAGQDFLHEQLAQDIAAEPTAQKNRDTKLAREIGMTTFEFSYEKREGKVSVDLIGAGGKKTNITLMGKLDNQMRMRVGDIKKAGGVAIEATCMDVGGGCQTTHIRVAKKMDGGTAMAHVITRLSNAYLYIEGNEPGISRNPEYDNLMTLLLNTVSNPNGPDSVQQLGFYTSEVIGGQSNFAVLMRLGIQDANKPRGDGQVLGLMGALVKPADKVEENFLIPNPPTIATVIGNRTFLLPTEIANTIRDIKVVRNDGRGNLQFYITVRKVSAASSEDTIRLTVARLQEPVRDLKQ